MIIEKVLPIDKIPPKSKIILYGAGKIGKKYWKQNQLLNWCNICKVVDINYKSITDFPVCVESPEKIRENQEYDYILLSIVADIVRKEAVEHLISMGVDLSVVIDSGPSFYGFEPDAMVSIEEGGRDTLRIAFLSVASSLGDNIIQLKIYQELIRMAPKSSIDIYTDLLSVNDASKVYYGQKNLHEIYQCQLDRERWKDYDLVIQVNLEPQLLYWNIRQIGKISPKLMKCLEILFRYQKRDGVDVSRIFIMHKILLERARFMGWNRYTLMGKGSMAFEIEDQHVDFYINQEYEKQYLNLRLGKKYITFNFGASDAFGSGKQQTKIWPYVYYEQLIRLLKSKFPEIEIVQLGGKKMRCIGGADRYIMGVDLEVVKYILKKSTFHFDCEGGLVHMATQLGTKCFVVFGPTPIWLYGYNENINIAPKICGECQGLIEEWQIRCYKYEKAECMYSITPEYVFSLMENYLVAQK